MKSKKIISLLLAAVMTASCLPVMAAPVMAAESTDLLAGITPTTTANATKVEGIGLDNTALGDNEGNEYLHFYNMDAISGAANGEGIKVSFKPVSGVTQYYLRFNARYANDSGNPGGGSYDYIRVRGVANAATSGSSIWGVGALPKRGWTKNAYNKPDTLITTTTSDVASVRVYKENRDTYPVVPVDFDDIQIYYLNGSSEVTVAKWDFEGASVADGKIIYGAASNPTAWIEADNYNTKDQYGPASIAVASEKDYVRYDDITGAKALTYTFTEALEPAVYTLTGDIRMDRFPSQGGEDTFIEADFETAITVTDSNGKTVGVLKITPEWDDLSLELAVLEPISAITLTADKANAIDIASLSLVKTRDVNYEIESDGIIGGANQTTPDEIGKSEGDNRYMRVYNRKQLSWDGVGFTFEGAFEKDKTYVITFDARKSLPSNKETSLTVSLDVKNYSYDTATAYYVLGPTKPVPTFFQAGAGVMIDEGWSTYTFKFTPTETVNELSVSLATNNYYTNRSSGQAYVDAWNITRFKDDGGNGDLTVNPFDIDNIIVYEDGKESTPIFSDNFENGTHDGIYVASKGVYAATANNKFTLGAGNSKITFDDDNYYTLVSTSGAPSMKLSDFEGLDLTKLGEGIYRFKADVRLGYYDGTLETDKNAVNLDFGVKFSDNTSDGDSVTVDTEWTTLEYSFYVSGDDAEIREITLDFSALGEGYTEKVGVINYRNLSIEEVSLFKNPITADGMDADGKLDLYTRSSMTESADDNGYLRVYNRQLGAFDGAGVKLEGASLEGGKTYCIAFEARKSHESPKNIAITVAGSSLQDNGSYFGLPTTYPQPYYDGSGGNGTVISDGWNKYIYEYTPAEDVADPVFYFMSNHYWNSRDGWKHWNDVRYGEIPAGGTLPQDSFTANPFDLDNVKIYAKGEENAPLLTDDFDGDVNGAYAPAKGKSQGYKGLAVYEAGNSKLAIESDSFTRVDGNGDVPSMEFTAFDLEVGKYAFEMDLSLNVYDAEIMTDKNSAKVVLTAEYSDSSVEVCEYEITTAFETLKYSFFVTEDAKLDKITLDIEAFGEGYTEFVGAFDYRNIAITDQIFTLEAADDNGKTNYLDGASIYSVGDTVMTEELNENGEQSGYVHVYNRPFGKYDGLGVKLNGVTLEGGATYYITFRARKSFAGEKDIALTAAGNALNTSGNYWAPPVNPPEPYQTGNGAVLKENWQNYTYAYTPAEDVTDPEFTFTSNHYYQQYTANADRLAYWNSVRYGEAGEYGQLGQNNFVMAPFDVDDFVIYKDGSANAPIVSDDFDEGLPEYYKVSEGYNQGSSGKAVYGQGSAEITHAVDVYGTVVNEKAAPRLVIGEFPVIEPGKYVFKAQVRAAGEYDGEKAFDEQATSTLNIIYQRTDADGNTKVRSQSFTVGNEWKDIYVIIEIEDEGVTLDEIVLALDGAGSFDYRNLSMLYDPYEEHGIPTVGILMMLLKKREKESDFEDGGKSDQAISVDRLPNYLEGAVSEEGIASWNANGQTLEYKEENGVKYLAASDIKDNYSGVVYENGKTLRAGTYRLKLKIRTDVTDDKPQVRINLSGIIKTVRISNEWTELEYVLEIKEETTLRFKISGGPLAFYTQNFDFADLSLICLDQLAEGQQITVGGNLFAKGDFEDPATAVLNWNRGINEKQGWTGIDITHNTEADGNGYLTASNRQANYQNWDINTGVAVEAGRTYTIKFRIRTSAPMETSGIRAYAGTTSSPSYKLKVGNEGSPDPASSWYNSFAVSGAWKEVTTTYVAEAGGALRIRFGGDTSADSIHNIDIDDIEVYLVFVG